jgi:hypothetical protein
LSPAYFGVATEGQRESSALPVTSFKSGCTGTTLKRPAFQFYPADWRKDMALQSCSVSARGLWVDMLCIAHECEPYGHLTVNGKAMTPAQIGRHTGLTERECSKLLDELADSGVSSVTAEGVIFSRRMVRDEEVRNKRAEGGKAGSEHGEKGAVHGVKGGRPKKVRGVSEPPIEPPPSSSSSSSSSEENPLTPKGADPEGFAEFWNSWPASPRKQDRKKCAAKWGRSKLGQSVDEIVQHVEAMKGTRQWLDGFEPAPLTYLNGERWCDGVPADRGCEASQGDNRFAGML